MLFRSKAFAALQTRMSHSVLALLPVYRCSMVEEARPVSLQGRKLMIAIPAYDGKLNIKSAFALARLAQAVSQYGIRLYLSHLSGCSLITQARNSLVADFLATDADAMLFVDADVVVTPEAILRLFALSIGKDITAGIYPRRGSDRKFFLDMPTDDNNRLMFDENGLLQVNRIGTGFMMIQRHVLEGMIAKHPEWGYHNNVQNRTDYAVFDFEIKDNQYFGEDYAFCDRARADGYSIYLDPTISLPHVGTEEFTRDFEEDVLKPLMQPVLKVANG